MIGMLSSGSSVFRSCFDEEAVFHAQKRAPGMLSVALRLLLFHSLVPEHHSAAGCTQVR